MSDPVIVPGKNLTAKLAWLQSNVQSDYSYIVEVNANESIKPQILSYDGKSDITITLKGIDKTRTISLSKDGVMFLVRSGITFVLSNNITLRGSYNHTPLVVVSGVLIMNQGSVITGNNNADTEKLPCGGVFVLSEGIFTMNGGTISYNTTNHGGGGVAVAGTFTMRDGTISDNNAGGGGGVAVSGDNATFNMNGGTISGNTADVGGGVAVEDGATFIMNEGIISGNTSKKGAGGVLVGLSNGNFTMKGGTISGNNSKECGGGIAVLSGVFTKKGGTITGYESDTINGNIVRDDAGIVKTFKGHAVAGLTVTDNEKAIIKKFKNNTAGPTVEMSYEAKEGTSTGTWDVKDDKTTKVEEQFELGFDYYYGYYISEDMEKARYWLSKAADQGHARAMYVLAMYYRKTEGTMPNSRMWEFINKSAELRDPFARKFLKEVDKNMGCGCYIATCIYGTYDCPEVWTLRRYRDGKLAASRFGRWFIRIYYAISPKIVELFGNKNWFKSLCKPILDKFIRKLQQSGLGGSPYSDI